MPLTQFQAVLAKLLAENRTESSHLAGGAALNFKPNSVRYSNDLDYFHDEVDGVEQAFTQDKELLQKNKYNLKIELQKQGYIRAVVEKDQQKTKIEWAYDSAWRFMPAQKSKELGYVLHPVDLAINKVLALAGRDEARDFLDIHEITQNTLSLGALCWAAAGKDPGFTPHSLLSLLQRRGKYQPEEFQRLQLNTSVDPKKLKQHWLQELEKAKDFIKNQDPKNVGCLFYSQKLGQFVPPEAEGEYLSESTPHFGKFGGVLPKLIS